LDPESGATREIPLGQRSSPHGVIVGKDGAPWITDDGQNAIVRIDPISEVATVFVLPEEYGRVSLNTAAFDGVGMLWFTGQAGVYGRVDPGTGRVAVWESPGGRGPYGITSTPNGVVYYASLAGNHIARLDPASSTSTPIQPPTPQQGARRVWSDSRGRIWVSEWNAGQLGMYDPMTGAWREWRLPGDHPQPYAVFVDEHDLVWLSDFGSNALVRFDPTYESFESFPIPTPRAEVRQLLGRPGEVWGAESGADRLLVVRTP
jgi:virginiamycin B lyase